MKRLLLLAAIAVAATLAFAGVAYANFGVHGGYMADTDACAGCHRAHTANSAIKSSIEWPSKTEQPSALLIIKPTSNSSETKLTAFCYTCHAGEGGASTDVAHGAYVSSTGAPTESDQALQMGLTVDLNGGAFGEWDGSGSTSNPPAGQGHTMDKANGTLYGSNPLTTIGNVPFTCATCHDPHGTSNYRMLKADVNGHTVGGYDTSASTADPAPTPYVVSAEHNAPAEGFKLHKTYWPVNGAVPAAYDGTTPAPYEPNYTTARYGNTGDSAKGITGWCVACHELYNSTSDPDPYDAKDSAFGEDTNVHRYRHQMNLPLSEYKDAASKLVYNPGQWQSTWPGADIPAVDLPLEHNTALASQPIGPTNSDVVSGGGKTIAVMKNTVDDRIGCLTCHRAHGTSVTMSGYANVLDAFSGVEIDPGVKASDPNTGDYFTPLDRGVAPAKGTALLRADNRGVCERCHNK